MDQGIWMQVTVNLEPKTYHALRHKAEQESLSVSEFIRQMIGAFLDGEPPVQCNKDEKSN